MLLTMTHYGLFAQPPHVDFFYDAAGNRVLRTYSASRLMDTTQHDTAAERPGFMKKIFHNVLVLEHVVIKSGVHKPLPQQDIWIVRKS